MASIDQLRLSETVVEGNKQVSESSEPSVNTDTATPDAALSTPTSNPASTLKAGPLNGNLPSSITDSNGTAISSKPALVQLGSGPNPSAPQPKRFSAVNINKTFLQKTSSSSNAAPAITSSASQKSGGPPVRPSAHSLQSHPRLVTTKLTAATPQTTTTGPGWSRPSSTIPSPGGAPTPPQGIQPSPNNMRPLSGPAQRSHNTTPPQSGSTGANDHANPNSTKPVWGNIKATVNPARPNARVENDFPTAAEVAHAAAGPPKYVKPTADPKQVEVDAAHKQARMKEADTFRGVHLDPNAHHWDEMEEDDDNFLDGVIEFGDGRQYKIEASEAKAGPASSHPTLSRQDVHAAPPPVSKQERFVDDFDRSWPKSQSSSMRSGATNGHVELPPVVVPPVSQPLHDSSRVLFNASSNKLEPYSKPHQSGPYPRRPEILTADRNPREHHAPPHLSHIQHSSPIVEESASSKPRSWGQNANKPPSSHSGSTHMTSPRDRDFGPIGEHRGRRSSNAGSSTFVQGRQAPPHLANYDSSMPPPPPPAMWRTPSHDSKSAQRYGGGPPSSSGRSARHMSPSPSRSHASSAAISAVLDLQNAGDLPDLNEMRRDLMQNAAARAKQRREQEELEREKERTRAKQKADEMAAKIAADQKKDAEVVAIIEGAVKGAVQPNEKEVEPVPQVRGHVRRLSSSRPMPPSRPGSFVAGAESWRKKEEYVPTHTSEPSSFVPPPPSVLEQTLAEESQADLEVVDFSDMSVFIGIPKEENMPISEESDIRPSERPGRPQASDFFTSTSSAVESGHWRKPNDSAPATIRSSEQVAREDNAFNGLGEVRHSPNLPRSNLPTPPSPSLGRRPQSSQKEVTVSAFDDTLSKIRGAMQSNEPTAPPQSTTPFVASSRRPSVVSVPIPNKPEYPRDRWVPPALRPKPPLERENFDVTVYVPPNSPKPAWNAFSVRLPTVSSPVDPLTKRQLSLWQKHFPVRLQVMCYDPPVEGVSRRESLLQDLFGKPQKLKGKLHYRVHLPRMTLQPVLTVNLNPPQGSRVFGRSPVSDNITSWRKSPAAPKETSETTATLDPTSRSPPPETTTPSRLDVSDSTSKSSAHVRLKSLSQAQGESSLPASKRTRAPTFDGKESHGISFTVGSELNAPEKFDEDLQAPIPSSQTNLSAQTSKSGQSLNVLNSVAQDEVRSSRPPTPPSSRHSASAWRSSALGMPVQESPSRGPDPEHLKAVWSQTANKPSINSLEGIGDDLTGLPFTLHDVKSEDGETPPAIAPSAPPSRMSIHDVRRAFQQVPNPSNGQSRPPFSPPSTNAPVARPAPNFSQPTFPPPVTAPANQAIRPPYPGFTPSPHGSPSPVMYPHPPSRVPSMNGGPPMYGAPMWVPMMPGPGTPGPPAQGMVRSIPSPYPGQMMAYPPPQGAHPMYMAPPMGPPVQAGNGRGRPMAMMSPNMQQAIPMYPGSPGQVMMSPVPPPGVLRPDPARPTQSGQYAPLPPFAGRPTW